MKNVIKAVGLVLPAGDSALSFLEIPWKQTCRRELTENSLYQDVRRSFP